MKQYPGKAKCSVRNWILVVYRIEKSTVNVFEYWAKFKQHKKIIVIEDEEKRDITTVCVGTWIDDREWFFSFKDVSKHKYG